MSGASVLSISPLPTETSTFGVYPNQHRRILKWLVALDSSDVGGDLVALNAGTPIITLANNDPATGLCCVAMTAQLENREDGGVYYIVTSEFKDDPIAATNILPWMRKDKVEMSKKVYSVTMEQDFSTPPLMIANSAGDPPPSPLVHDFVNPLLRVRRARQAAGTTPFDYAAAQAAQGTVNDVAFTIAEITNSISVPIGGAMLHSVVATPAVWYTLGGTPAAINYYDIVFELELSGQYPPPTGGLPGGNLGLLRMNNTGVYCMTDSNNDGSGGGSGTIAGSGTKAQAWNPIADPLHPGQMLTRRGRKKQIPVTRPVPLNSDGSRVPDSGLTASNLATKVLTFTRFPTGSWGSFIQ
jgi:hypothetical protein